MNGWIGVDLDGTLAHYDKWVSPTHIGEPVKLMLERVKGWLAQGVEVRIFTARVSHDNSPGRMVDAEHSRTAIEQWLVRHLGVKLPITNIKDYAMLELWDDRAVQVRANTGEPVGFSTRNV